MFIRQLSYVVALARERHFARAAETCHVSQPTLSAGIQHLEKELGVSIVKRAQRFEGFTTEGERVLAWAQRILADWDGLRTDVRSMRGQPAGELRCGAIPTALPVVSLLTGPCRTEYPGITPVILSLPSAEIIRQLETFELDVGITYLDGTDRAQLIELPLYRERYVLLVRDAAALRGRRTIAWAEAAELPLCLLTPNMQNRGIVDAAFQAAGTTPVIAVETDTLLGMYAHVLFSDLAGVMPHSLLALFPREHGLQVLDLEPSLHKQVGLLVLRRDPRAPLVEAFMQVVRQLDTQARMDKLIRAY